jgi:hypothetical protein
MMCLWVSYMKNIWFFLQPYVHWRKDLGPEFDPDADPLVRGTDTGIRTRTKMSRIPNTAKNYRRVS